MSSFIEKLVRRYNAIYPEKDNILPITSAKDVDKCKDFDVDKVDLRYNTLPISNEKTEKNIKNTKNKNNIKEYNIVIDSNV